MSILIKGMEMPPNCEECPFLDDVEGFCNASGEWVGGTGERQPSCPLVPVVRCKECKNWKTVIDPQKADYGLCELGVMQTLHKDFFCSLGERREDK